MGKLYVGEFGQGTVGDNPSHPLWSSWVWVTHWQEWQLMMTACWTSISPSTLPPSRTLLVRFGQNFVRCMSIYGSQNVSSSISSSITVKCSDKIVQAATAFSKRDDRWRGGQNTRNAPFQPAIHATFYHVYSDSRVLLRLYTTQDLIPGLESALDHSLQTFSRWGSSLVTPIWRLRSEEWVSERERECARACAKCFSIKVFQYWLRTVFNR